MGSTISPHVASWSERIRVNGTEADFEEAVARVRVPAEELEATQFEIVTAAALAAFAHARVDVAVVEAGLGGRYDATNVLAHPGRAPHERRARAHGCPRRHARGDRDREARRRAGRRDRRPARTARYAHLVPGRDIVLGGAREAAEAFVGHAIAADPVVVLPGRFERRGGEVRDGAHNPDGARHLVEQLDGDDYTVVASILADKDVDAMLRILRRVGARFVATRSSSPRALPADDLAEVARRHFDQVEVVDDPVAAVARAHELGEPVLVTGSLYLLGDLAQEERRAAWRG